MKNTKMTEQLPRDNSSMDVNDNMGPLKEGVARPHDGNQTAMKANVSGVMVSAVDKDMG